MNMFVSLKLTNWLIWDWAGQGEKSRAGEKTHTHTN